MFKLSLLFGALTLFCGTSHSASNDYDKQLTNTRLSIQSVNDNIAKLQDKIDRCQEAVATNNKVNGDTYKCSGFFSNATKAELDGWKAQIQQYKQTAQTLQSDLKAQGAAKDLSAVSKMEINGKLLEAQLLMADANQANAALKSAGIDIQAMNLKFDQSILGQYTKYAIDNALKSQNGQQAICKAVATCSDTKAIKTSMTDLDKKMDKSFTTFRTEQVRLMEIAEKAAAAAGTSKSQSSGDKVKAGQ